MRFVLVSLLVGCGSVQSPQTADAPSGESDAPDEEPIRMTIAELRALPDGPTNVRLEPARVTYIRNRSPHLQVNTVGPAIFVFVPANAPSPGLEIGNTVELHVTEVSTFEGNRQISTMTVLSNDNGNFDVSTLVQTLTNAPNEDLESELVRIQRGSVTEFSPPNRFVIQLITNATFELFSPVGAQVGLDCIGTSFDVIGVVAEFMGRHQVVANVAEDFSNVNRPAGCP
jgi:hypothetical protein